jgi:hypothetical protein
MTSSKEQIIIEDFLKEKSIPHIYLINSQDYAISHMKNNKIESMSYDEFIKISISNISNVEELKLDKDGNYSFIYPVQWRKKGDVIENISITSSNKKIKSTILFNFDELEIIKHLVTCTIDGDISFKLKFSFPDKPSFKDEIIIQSRNYILSDIDRNQLKSSVVITEDFTYEEGLIKLRI